MLIPLRSNLKLDKTLHDLLLKTLLPKSTLETATRPSEKRQALSGRLLELSSLSLPGEGTKSLSTSSLSSHPAKIRTGLIKASERREAKAKREKEMADGKLGGAAGRGEGSAKFSRGGAGSRGKREFGMEDGGRKKGMGSRKESEGQRSMGLGMGIGRFEGGMLKLSKREVDAGSGDRERSSRGRGGKRGGSGSGR